MSHDHQHGPSTAMPMDEHAGHNMDMGGQGGHSMAFHFGNSELVLFQFWRTASPLGILASVVVIIGMSFLRECVRWARVRWESSVSSSSPAGTPKADTALLIHRISDMGLHAVQVTLNYLLMLVFMTFNVTLCLAVVVGEVVSRFVFTTFLPRTPYTADDSCM